MLSNVYFINKDGDNSSSNQQRIDRVNQQKDSISGKYFDVLVKIKGLEESNALKDSALYKRDSLLRKKAAPLAKDIIQKTK